MIMDGAHFSEVEKPTDQQLILANFVYNKWSKFVPERIPVAIGIGKAVEEFMQTMGDKEEEIEESSGHCKSNKKGV